MSTIQASVGVGPITGLKPAFYRRECRALRLPFDSIMKKDTDNISDELNDFLDDHNIPENHRLFWMLQNMRPPFLGDSKVWWQLGIDCDGYYLFVFERVGFVNNLVGTIRFTMQVAG